MQIKISVSNLPPQVVRHFWNICKRRDSVELSIYHNGQFFVGLIEFKQGNKSKFVQHIFGKEPDDLEILNYIYNHLLNHLDDTETTILTKKKKVKINPKRLQREVAKEQKQPKDITYAQLALKRTRAK